MQTTLTFRHAEWYALLELLKGPGIAAKVESDLVSRIRNAIGRSWLAGRQDAEVDLIERDAAVLRELRAGLPDAETLAVIAEAEQIIRNHQRRNVSR